MQSREVRLKGLNTATRGQDLIVAEAVKRDEQERGGADRAGAMYGAKQVGC